MNKKTLLHEKIYREDKSESLSPRKHLPDISFTKKKIPEKIYQKNIPEEIYQKKQSKFTKL